MTPARGYARDRQLDLDFPKMTLTNVGFTFCIFFSKYFRVQALLSLVRRMVSWFCFQNPFSLSWISLSSRQGHQISFPPQQFSFFSCFSSSSFLLPFLLLLLLSCQPWSSSPCHPGCCCCCCCLCCLLQMIIRMGRPFANDHPNEPIFCKFIKKTPASISF